MTTMITRATYDGDRLTIDYGDQTSLAIDTASIEGRRAARSSGIDVGLSWVADADDLVGRAMLRSPERAEFASDCANKEAARVALIAALHDGRVRVIP